MAISVTAATTAAAAAATISVSLFSFQTPNGRRNCLRIRAPPRSDRQSVHFTMLLDTSGSMEEENRLDNVKWSLKHILKYLTADDKISLIEFNEYAEILFKQKAVTPDNKILIEHTIERIKAYGGTNLSSSIVTARDCLYLSDNLPNIPSTSMKQGIVLLTDGYANQGIMNHEEINRILARVILDSNGASLACIGYGVTHNSELMRSMSTEGGGSYNVVQTLEDIAEVFADILGGLISCSAQKVEIIIPGRYSARNLNTHYAVHFNADANTTRIILGDLQSENEVVLILPHDIDVLTVKGYDLCHLEPFETVVRNTSDLATTDITTDDEKKVGLVNYFRLETARVVDEVRAVLSENAQNLTQNQIENLRDRLTVLRGQIEIANTSNEHLLYGILLEEILEMNTAITTIENSIIQTPSEASTIAMETSQVFAQHLSFLSLGRGVRSHFTPATPNLRQLSRQASGNPRLQSTFSNTLQRHISQDITSQIDEHVENIETDPRNFVDSLSSNSVNISPQPAYLGRQRSVLSLRSPPRIIRNFPPLTPPAPIPENIARGADETDEV